MDKDEIWNAALSLLLESAEGDDAKSAFLSLLTPIGIFGDQFLILAENSQIETWIRKNCLNEIQETVRTVGGPYLNVGLASSNQKEAQQVPSFASQGNQGQSGFSQEPQQAEPEWMNHYVDPMSLHKQSFNQTGMRMDDEQEGWVQSDPSPKSGSVSLFSKCTFETFVVGHSNRLARNAALAVAEQPGIAYNPLFIYGDSGLGKTHLLVAIANYAMQNFPGMTTRYVSAERFIADYVGAARENKWERFREKYNHVDILLVDDIQDLKGADETTNQLFNIFNEMTSKNKQVVLSADRAPQVIDMDDRMKSRFLSGMCIDIKPPNYETKLAILKNHLEMRKQQTNFYGDISDDVLSYLANVATPNIRVMEGAVNRLAGNMALLDKSSISVEEAQELLKDFFPSTKDRQVDIALIQSEVEKSHNVTHEDLISGKRSKDIAWARHIAIYLSRYLTDESLASIGKRFGGRDHTTIINSVRKIEDAQKSDKNLFEELEQLRLRITSS